MKKVVLLIIAVALTFLIAQGLHKIEKNARIRGWVKTYGDVYPGWTQKYELGHRDAWWDSSWVREMQARKIVVWSADSADSGIVRPTALVFDSIIGTYYSASLGDFEYVRITKPSSTTSDSALAIYWADTNAVATNRPAIAIVMDTTTASPIGTKVMGIDFSGTAFNSTDDYMIWYSSVMFWCPLYLRADAIRTVNLQSSYDTDFNITQQYVRDIVLKWNATKKGDIIFRDGNNGVANPDFFQIQDSSGAIVAQIGNDGSSEFSGDMWHLDKKKSYWTDGTPGADTSSAGQDGNNFIFNSDNEYFFKVGGVNRFMTGNYCMFYGGLENADDARGIQWDGKFIKMDYDADAETTYYYAHGTDGLLRYIATSDQWEFIDNLYAIGTLKVDTILGDGSFVQIGDAKATSDWSLSADDDLLITGKLEVDGDAFFDGAAYYMAALQLYDNKNFIFGNGGDANLDWSTAQTNHGFMIGLGNTSRYAIICESADKDIDFGKGNQTNPTLFIHSADATDLTQWISFAHDQTDAVISSGKGTVKVDDDLNVTGSISVGLSTITASADDVPVDSVTVLNVDTNGGHVTIGGFTGGVANQILHIYNSDANNIIIEDDEGTGNQDIKTNTGADVTITAEGGCTLVYDGTDGFWRMNGLAQ